MPRPVARKTGVYHLNVRVPADLTHQVIGSLVTLPLAGSVISIKANDKIIMSLRTKDMNVARTRFVEAYGALFHHFEALRAGPKPLTHRQIVALAGEASRSRAGKFDAAPVDVVDGVIQDRETFAAAVEGWRDNEEGERTVPYEEARFLAKIQRPYGPQLLALETMADVQNEYVSITLDQALQDLFGTEADLILAQHHLVIDGASRKRLLLEIGKAVHFFQRKLNRNTDGDYSPDPYESRFPAFDPPLEKSTSLPASNAAPSQVDVTELFARWSAHNADKKAPATIRRYTPSIESLARFTRGRDIRLLTPDDIWAWAEQRRDTDGISPATINRNDLVAAASIFQFATTREADKKTKIALRKDNPVLGIKLDLPKKRSKRDKTFKATEITEILILARGVNDPRYPRASASRRWSPWICAYSGARIQEVCWLSKKDIWCEKGIWVMRFPMTKDGHARTVPLHDALIDEGFLDFWRNAPDGPLFVGDRPQKPGATRSAPEQRASEIAAWIQEKIKLEEGVSPNHGWRHTFITNAEGADIWKRTANAITGHNKNKDASDGYVALPVEILKRALDKYPRYVID
ncbi:MAG: DUF6538 domain-containing protein [Beijerinckiaceae bacterium]|jgi:integrase